MKTLKDYLIEVEENKKNSKCKTCGTTRFPKLESNGECPRCWSDGFDKAQEERKERKSQKK